MKVFLLINGSSRETIKSRLNTMMKQRWGLDRHTTCCDRHLEIPGVSNNATGTREQNKTNSWIPVGPATDKNAPPQPTKINSGTINESDARATGVQLKREAKLLSVTGLSPKHADYRIISMLYPIRIVIFWTDQKNQPYLHFWNLYTKSPWNSGSDRPWCKSVFNPTLNLETNS